MKSIEFLGEKFEHSLFEMISNSDKSNCIISIPNTKVINVNKNVDDNTSLYGVLYVEANTKIVNKENI